MLRGLESIFILKRGELFLEFYGYILIGAILEIKFSFYGMSFVISPFFYFSNNSLMENLTTILLVLDKLVILETLINRDIDYL